MMQKKKWIVLIIFALVLSSLACNFGFGRRSTPENSAQLTAEAVNNQSGSGTGFTEGQLEPITVTEAQLLDLMQGELQDRIGDQVSNLQVYLRDGQIQILGDVNTQGISAPVKVVVDVRVDPVGRPSLQIISSNIGPFPVPGDLIDEVELLINKAFQEKVVTLAPNMHIDSIVIANGTMTIFGHQK
jgi:uncharacterized protein YpmS